MAAAIGLREDFGSAELRALAKSVKGAAQARRLLTLAVIYDGGSRTDAARIGGVGLQIVRDWVKQRPLAPVHTLDILLHEASPVHQGSIPQPCVFTQPGSKARARGGSELGLQGGTKLTFDPEHRQAVSVIQMSLPSVLILSNKIGYQHEEHRRGNSSRARGHLPCCDDCCNEV